MSVAQPKHRPLAREAARVLNGTWPWPALAVWGLCWFIYTAGLPWWGVTLVGVGLSGLLTAPWRRFWVALGFPLSSWLVATQADAAAWWWALPLLLLWAIYPAGRWRDAPWYPTAPQALRGLSGLVPLPPGARVLELGCGLGDGLLALHEQYPQAQLHGLEWSAPLLWWCRWRMRWHRLGPLRLQRCDMWQADWSGHELIYLFHRPDTMAQAQRKAAALPPGTWVVSLVFEMPDWTPVHRLAQVPGRPVWVYRVPASRGEQPPQQPPVGRRGRR